VIIFYSEKKLHYFSKKYNGWVIFMKKYDDSIFIFLI
jgi:hypothetical protein